MAQFDPRRQPTRLAPHMLTAVAAISVAMFADTALSEEPLLRGTVYPPFRNRASTLAGMFWACCIVGCGCLDSSMMA